MRDKQNHTHPQKKADDGVSPVVGVMLMLVVTIIVAAVVAAFASGMGSSQTPAPAANLDVSLFRSSHPTAVIENVAGSTLDTKDLFITVTYVLPANYGGKALENGGKTITHSIDGALEPSAMNDLNRFAEGYPFTYQITNNADAVSKRVADEQKFGEATLPSGSSIVFDLSYFVGFPVTKTEVYGISPSSAFHVTVVHKPSETVLYDRDVKVHS